jgi:hypothetical protein
MKFFSNGSSGALYWLQIFAPRSFVRVNFLLVYSKTENKIVAIIFLSVGLLGGIFLANLSGESMALKNSLQTFTDLPQQGTILNNDFVTFF